MSKQELRAPELTRTTKSVNLSELYPLIQEVLQSGGTFTLTITGSSMYTMCGDHQWQKEHGIRQEQLVALATAFVRKGKKLTNRNVLYRVYRTVWTWLLKARPFFFWLDGYRLAAKQILRKKQLPH